VPYATTNPATGELEREFDTIDAAAVDAAVDRADEAFSSWRARPIAERAQVATRIAELFDERREELAQLVTREMGKLIEQARGEVDLSAKIFRYYADNAERLTKDVPYEVESGSAKVVTRPIGALIGVMPWNFPYYQVARFAAPNIVLGNTILLKHAPINPQCALALQSLFDDAGAPEGVYQNLFCDTDDVERIIDNPKVAGASLTGSEKAGQSVAEIAGRNLKKVVLELGGSDAFIVLDLDNADATITAAVAGRMNNMGQSCVASKRFIVLDEFYDEFVERFAAGIADVVQGDPADESTTLGPLSSAGAVDTLEELVDDALQHGAEAVVGGARIDAPGNYFEATVLTAVTAEARAYTEELFGPVAVVYRAKDEDEAIELANAVPYGLGGTVIGADVERAERVGDRIETGMVWINHPTGTQADLPFGGVKRSGIGRELADLGLGEFVNKKLIRVLPAGSDIGQADG
jgi:succinate-semialdehyde dehydrogenase/glutarate-semialdehyde dehydrogenase